MNFVALCSVCYGDLVDKGIIHSIFRVLCETWVKQDRGFYFFDGDTFFKYLEAHDYIITTEAGIDRDTGREVACAIPRTLVAEDHLTGEEVLWICRGCKYHE